MEWPVSIPCLAAALAVANVSPSLAADPAVTECGQAYLRLERAFAQRSLRLGRLLCEWPDRVDDRAVIVVRATNAEIADFNQQYTAAQCDPDVQLPVPVKTVADVRRVLEGQLRSVPLDRFCNGETDPLPLCGNGQADPGELCDGGDLAGQSCQTLRQGSGTLACAIDCQTFVFGGCSGPAICGNGIEEPEHGEECDTGGQSETCDSDCTQVECGDGTVNSHAMETCDDANITDSDDCVDCRHAFCGDRIVHGEREQCDEGFETDGCYAYCRIPVCGDDITNPGLGEECDDGNLNSGDGCSAVCLVEGP